MTSFDCEKIIESKRDTFESAIAEAEQGRIIYNRYKSELRIRKEDTVIIYDIEGDEFQYMAQKWINHLITKKGIDNIVVFSKAGFFTGDYKSATLDEGKLRSIIQYYKFCEFHPHVYVAKFDEVLGDVDIFDKEKLFYSMFRD